MQAIIVLQFDNVYFEWGELFLRSLANVAKQEKVIIYSLGLSTEQIETLKRLYRNVTVHNARTFLPKGRWRRYKMANRKAKIFQQAMQEYPSDLYIFMDADLLIRKSLKELYSVLKPEDDVALVFRPEEPNHTRINSSIIMARASARPLIDQWVDMMKTSSRLYTVDPTQLTWWEKVRNRKKNFPVKPLRVDRGNWFWDQITLWETVKQNDSLQYASISPEVFINGNFDPEAPIWSAHAASKKEAYQKFAKDL